MRGSSFPAFEVSASALVAIIPAFVVSPAMFFTIFVVAGQAHFASAWFFQWKAGKMPPMFVISLMLFALGVAVFVVTASYTWQVAIAGALFTAPHLFDEFRLLGYAMTARRFVEMTIPVFLYGGVFFTSIFGSNIGTTISGLLALCAIAFFAVLLLRKADGYHVDTFTWYMLAFAPPLGYLFFHENSIEPQFIIGTLIIYHYSKWYLYSYRRIPSSTGARKSYLWNIVLINVGIGAPFSIPPRFS